MPASKFLFVPIAVDIPSFLLRIALTLFLIGMVSFLKDLNLTVYWAVTTPVIAWFVVYAASIVLPSIYQKCPYKSPEAFLFYLSVSLCKYTIHYVRTLPSFHPGRDASSGKAHSHSAYTAASWSDHEHRVQQDTKLVAEPCGRNWRR